MHFPRLSYRLTRLTDRLLPALDSISVAETDLLQQQSVSSFRYRRINCIDRTWILESHARNHVKS